MKYYRISESELLSLLKDSREFIGLEAAGVNCWGGVDFVEECLEDYPRPTLESIAEDYEEVL